MRATCAKPASPLTKNAFSLNQSGKLGMDYTAWREKHMYLDEDVHSLAERARAAARRFDAMNGDYTRLREGVFDGTDVANELDGKVSAWKSANHELAMS